MHSFQYLTHENVFIEWYPSAEAFLESSLNKEDRFVLVDFSCESTDNLFDAISERRLFHTFFHYIIYNAVLKNLEESFERFDINCDTKVTVLIENDDEMLLYKVWSPSLKKGGPLEVKVNGHFNGSMQWIQTKNKKVDLKWITLSAITVVSMK